MDFDLSKYVSIRTHYIILSIGIIVSLLVCPVTAWALAINGNWKDGMVFMTIVYVCFVKEKITEWSKVKPK